MSELLTLSEFFNYRRVKLYYHRRFYDFEWYRFYFIVAKHEV